MIGLDTNVLVRYLVEDDREQNRLAAQLFETALRRGTQLFVSQIVLCELVWVLDAGYGFPRAQVIDLLDSLLRARQLRIEDSDAVREALDRFAQGAADFADYVVLVHAKAAGSERVASFDRNLLGEPEVFAP